MFSSLFFALDRGLDFSYLSGIIWFLVLLGVAIFTQLFGVLLVYFVLSMIFGTKSQVRRDSDDLSSETLPVDS